MTAGTEFDFSVSLKQLGEEEDLLFLLLEGLKLLEKDASSAEAEAAIWPAPLHSEDEAIQKKLMP